MSNPHTAVTQLRRPPVDGSAVRYMRPQAAADITNGFISALKWMAGAIGDDTPCHGDDAWLRAVIGGAKAWEDHLVARDDPDTKAWKAELWKAIADAENLIGSLDEGRERPW